VFTLKAVEAALAGDESPLAAEAGPGVLLVDAELASVVVAPRDADHIVLGWRREQDVEISTIALPDGFLVREVGVEDGRFVLTGVDGRTIRGTPDQFTAHPEVLGVLLEPPTADLGLSDVARIVAAGEVTVRINGEPVWVNFDEASPEQVAELLPRARELLASFEQLGRTAAEYLLARLTEGDDEEADEADGEFDEAEYFDDMVPTSLVINPTGEFVLHFEGVSGTYFLDGYWPSVLFTPDRQPVDFAIEA
jgi:hypothetical protein